MLKKQSFFFAASKPEMKQRQPQHTCSVRRQQLPYPSTRSSTKSLLLRNIHHRATCQPNIIHSIHRVQYQLRFTSSINKTTQNNSTFYTPPIQEQEEEETSKS
ncbi:hypothetical protein SEVIR_8G016300v4 [Setaria viridis]|uniref:Uncharacterized protein n=1 Tax=Setaria viridis TaxID=4556 RepID=A0A4U6TAS5_SETVI|nr:hypothetical protein SEVIR_8G016300v2 [Setaria viridis]TKV99091.1 hypothetical protein SEVIR_8G016300v2 [Setaria viridis]TKV99092.1 hypothetical protein SEVIR_8G016300v2 [Setaria viridis]TKV99093.1 hypothetical protein SEVIR_8G016300v2 [Setaria viridis]